MVSGIGVGTLQNACKTWFADKVRIGEFTLNMPVPLIGLAPGQTSTPYPPSTAIMQPIRSWRIVKSGNQGLLARAELRFNLVYRFPKVIPYHALPHRSLHNLLSNVYIQAVLSPQDISPFINSITTPDRGIDVVIGNVQEGGTDTDWLMQLNFVFDITFRTALDDTDGIQDNDGDLPVAFNSITIATYRAAIEYADDQLDRTITLQQQQEGQ